ncbi:MAG: SDR family NAD(P)-dependent oxidoreductase [Myxococcota bacterium]
MRILVTGASRGAGRSMAEELAARGHEVRALVRRPDDITRLSTQWSDQERLTPVLGDVTERASLDAAMDGCEALIHAAAAVGEEDGDRALFHRVNVEGTGNVWRAAGRARVRSAVMISSVAIYGRPNVPEVSEDAPRAKLEVAYEQTKAAAENVALELGRLFNIRTAVLRPSVIYGPYDEQFVPRLVRSLRSHSFIYVGDPDRPINLCAVEHLTWCAFAALQTPAAAGEAFNVVDGVLPSWRQTVELICHEAGFKVPTRVVDPQTALRLGTAVDKVRKLGLPLPLPAVTRFTARVAGTSCVYRIDKARRILGYRPVHTFMERGPALVRAYLSA